MTTVRPLYLLSDMLVEVDGLTNDKTGLVVSDAVINLTLVDHATGDAIDGQVWPTAFVLKAGSTNLYQAVIDKAVQVVENGIYEAQITAAVPGGVDRQWVQLLLAKRPYV